MRILLVILVLLLTAPSFAQSEALGKNYFDRGEYEKALVIFKKLERQNPNRAVFANYILKIAPAT